MPARIHRKTQRVRYRSNKLSEPPACTALVLIEGGLAAIGNK
jgi:hypothetical protein